MDSPKAPRTKILKQRPFCQAVFRGGRRITLHKVEVTYECLDTGTIFTHTHHCGKHYNQKTEKASLGRILSWQINAE